MGACGKNHNHRLERTQVQAHKLPVTNTSSTHSNTCNVKFKPLEHAPPLLPCCFISPHSPSFTRTLKSFLEDDRSRIVRTFAYKHARGPFFSSHRTGAWTGRSSLFSRRRCFEFQRGAHERAAEYKGVPKDTLQRSM